MSTATGSARSCPVMHTATRLRCTLDGIGSKPAGASRKLPKDGLAASPCAAQAGFCVAGGQSARGEASGGPQRLWKICVSQQRFGSRPGASHPGGMGLSVRCIGDVRPIVGPRAHVQTEDRISLVATPRPSRKTKPNVSCQIIRTRFVCYCRGRLAMRTTVRCCACR